MRVVHVSPTYYSNSSVIGGGERYVLYMAQALSLAAHQLGQTLTSSLVSFSESPSIVHLNSVLDCHLVEGRPWDARHVCGSVFDPYFKTADVVVVHQCLSTVGLFAASRAKMAGNYVVGLDHGGGEHEIVSHSPEAAGMYDLFCSQSSFAAAALDNLGVPTVIARGPIDTTYFTPDAGIQRDSSLIVAVGRLLPHKGFDRLIRALPPSLRLIVAGRRSDMEYFNYLDGLRNRSSAPVEIVEDLEDQEIRTLMRRASLFVHPSTHIDDRGRYYAKPELLGLAPLEALSCGTPALVSTAGALSELSLIEGCRTFHDDQDLRSRLIAHARAPFAYPPAQAIHDSVDSAYGMMQYGERVFGYLRARGVTS